MILMGPSLHFAISIGLLAVIANLYNTPLHTLSVETSIPLKSFFILHPENLN